MATLEGERKGHAVTMEELEAQLRRALADNSTLEEQLKDQHRIGLQKQKELDDAHREAADSEKQLSGCIEIFGYLHKTPLGIFASHFVCIEICLHCTYTLFRYA
jgi:chromosome segregation ATPase